MADNSNLLPIGPTQDGLTSIPILVTQGGTGTTTQFTPGSVVFAGTNGVYTQDNANLFFDDTTNTLQTSKVVIDVTDAEAFLVRKDADGGDVFSIDTSTPQESISNTGTLTKTASISAASFTPLVTNTNGGSGVINELFLNYNDNAGASVFNYFVRAHGTQAAPTVVVPGDRIMSLISGGWSGTTFRVAGELVMLVDNNPTVVVSATSVPGMFNLNLRRDGVSGMTNVMSVDNMGNTLFVTGANGVARTASVQDPGFRVNQTAIKTFATGAMVTQHASVFDAPTYAFTGASTISDSATINIVGSPQQGTNATITRAYGLMIGNIGGWTSNIEGVADGLGIVVPGVTNGTVTPGSRFGLSVLGGVTSLGDQIATISSVRSASFIGATYAATAAVTVNGPTTYYVSGPPVASTNVTFSAGPWAGWIDDGAFRIDGYLLLGATALPTVNGTFVQIQSAATSGSPTAFSLTAGAHTTLAASTEAIDVNFNLARNVQFATGDFTLQRAFVIEPPTYSFVGASTIILGATVEITGAPITGTNATIQNVAALVLGDIAGWTSKSDSAIGLVTILPGISNGVGNVSSRVGLGFFGPMGGSTHLGDQTATLGDITMVSIDGGTFTSTTNTRTVNGKIAALYISGAPQASTNVVFSKTPYSLFIDDGLPRIDSSAANDTVATVLGTLGPTGSHTTVQEWLKIDISGQVRFIPCF